MFSFHFFVYIFNNKYQVKKGFHYKFVLLKKWKKNKLIQEHCSCIETIMYLKSHNLLQ